MKIVTSLPPNWEQIKRVYSPDKDTVVVTYGDTLYNPGGKPIDKYLLNHELTHHKQQELMTPEEWWRIYLVDKNFMIEQETEAYRYQYKTFCKENTGKKLRKEFLNELTKQFSSKQYGNTLSPEEARNAISNK